MTGEAEILLAEITDYCARTDTPAARVGEIAFHHPGFVGLLRRRKLLSESAAKTIREILAAFPDGIRIGDRRPLHLRTERDRRQIEDAKRRLAAKAKAEAMPRVHRDSCPRCGARGDLNCGHSQIRLGESFG